MYSEECFTEAAAASLRSEHLLGMGAISGALPDVPSLAAGAQEYVTAIDDGVRSFVKGNKGKHTSAQSDLKRSRFSDLSGTGDPVNKRMEEARESVMSKDIALKRISDNLAALRMEDPILADKVAALNERKLGFLASKLPRRESVGAVDNNFDRYQPTDAEKHRFARYAAAVDNPSRLVSELQTGRLTKETVEAVQNVWPELHTYITGKVIEHTLENKKSLTYQQRTVLSILTGTEADSTMRPDFIRGMQENYHTDGKSQPDMGAPPKAGTSPGLSATKAQEMGAS